MADIQKTVVELQETTQNIKVEILDIKEILADSYGRMENFESNLSQTKTDFNNLLKTSLIPYVNKDTLDDTCYNKTEIDTRFDELDCVSIEDVQNYLNENDYVTSGVLKNYINMSSLENYVDMSLQDYITKTDIEKTYATKLDVEEKLNIITVDLEPYVTKEHLVDNYYTKTDVDSLIPSTSGFVKKTELMRLIPIDDYALQEYVDKTFIKKGEISLTGYVTEDILNNSLKKYDDMVTSSTFTKSLSNYVKKENLRNDLINLQNAIKDEYIPFVVNNMGYVTNEDVSKKYATKEEVRNILNGSIEIDTSILDEYITETELSQVLENYVPLTELNKRDEKIISDISDNVENTFNSFKSNYITSSDIKKTYATKEELRNCINNIDTGISIDLTDYVKKDDLINYVNINTFNNGLNKLNSDIKNFIIPQTLETFKTENNFVSKTYVDGNFAKKSDVVKNIETINETISNLNFDDYVVKSDMENYMSKSDMEKYVDNKTFFDFLTNTNSNVSKINDSLKNCVKTSQIKDYVRLDSLELTLNDYVTKSTLEDELKKLINGGVSDNTNTDISELPTFKDINKLSTNINNSLNKYTLRNEVYTKDYINNNYLDVDELNENYLSKQEGDKTFLSKNDANKEYLKITTAESKFLLKEDYRGIKDAMVLSSTYKYSGDMFNRLVEESKVQNGFYIVDNNVIIVKDNEQYGTNLLNKEDTPCSKEYVNETFVSKDELENYTVLNWKVDKGGNY